MRILLHYYCVYNNEIKVVTIKIEIIDNLKTRLDTNIDCGQCVYYCTIIVYTIMKLKLLR